MNFLFYMAVIFYGHRPVAMFFYDEDSACRYVLEHKDVELWGAFQNKSFWAFRDISTGKPEKVIPLTCKKTVTQPPTPEPIETFTAELKHAN